MFIAPAFILFTLFIIVPTVSSVYYSLTSWDGISPDIKFIGLANYKEIFTSDRFGNAMKNTIILTVFISIFENIIALALALIVDNVRWGKNFFRSGFYIPVLISGIGRLCTITISVLLTRCWAVWGWINGNRTGLETAP